MAERWETLIRLINENGFTSVAEVGMNRGDTMRQILDACPQVTEYGAVDVDLTPMRDNPLLVEHLLSGTIKELEMTSVEAAQWFADESLDLVFIDAAHDLESIRANIAAWGPKVRPGGILSGHDYTQGYPEPMPACDGVKQAVDEAFPEGVNLVQDIMSGEYCYVWWIEQGGGGEPVGA